MTRRSAASLRVGGFAAELFVGPDTERDVTNLTMSAVLLVGILATTAAGQDEARTRDDFLGIYGSVTESECNVTLELLDGGKAQIVETCRAEDGSHKDTSEMTQATWSFEGNRLTVEHENGKDLLDYDPSLSYRDFGDRGSGPGLKPLDKVGSGSRLFGYGHLWKRPLAEEKNYR